MFLQAAVDKKKREKPRPWVVKSILGDYDQSDSDQSDSSLTGDDEGNAEENIRRKNSKEVIKVCHSYRDDPDYWMGRRDSTIFQLKRRSSLFMYPQLKETSDSGELAWSLIA
jgi:hypothetical protein